MRGSRAGFGGRSDVERRWHLRGGNSYGMEVLSVRLRLCNQGRVTLFQGCRSLHPARARVVLWHMNKV